MLIMTVSSGVIHVQCVILGIVLMLIMTVSSGVIHV